MKQSKLILIAVSILSGCATTPPSEVDIARAHRENVCKYSSDSECEKAMQQEVEAITKQQSSPSYQFQRKLDETALKYDSLNETIKLQQQLRDIQLYGIGH
jgi:hypothetical protein